MLNDYVESITENFADGKKRVTRPAELQKAGASCKGSVSSLRAKAPNTVAKRVKCTLLVLNMKGGKKGK